eukprot:scaffold106646_cov31-Tisochrysis_lutea.AAC.4
MSEWVTLREVAHIVVFRKSDCHHECVEGLQVGRVVGNAIAASLVPFVPFAALALQWCRIRVLVCKIADVLAAAPPPSPFARCLRL